MREEESYRIRNREGRKRKREREEDSYRMIKREREKKERERRKVIE